MVQELGSKIPVEVVHHGKKNQGVYHHFVQGNLGQHHLLDKVSESNSNSIFSLKPKNEHKVENVR